MLKKAVYWLALKKRDSVFEVYKTAAAGRLTPLCRRCLLGANYQLASNSPDSDPTVTV